MRNRGLKSIYQGNARTVLNVQAEDEKIHPRGLVHPVPSPGIQMPIQNPEIDDSYFRKMYSLQRSFTPKPGDVLFDHTAYQIIYNAHTIIPVIGQQLTMYTFNVPKSQRFVITGFCFFLLCDDTPVVADFGVLCRPFELLSYIDFLILVNGKVPVQADYTITPFVGAGTTRTGWAVLSQDPERDSNTTPIGYAIPIQPGAKMEIIIRNINYALTGVRDLRVAGFRMRGFFSDEKLEEE